MGTEYRTIWISDIHLGTRACKAELLLDFLRHHESEQLYLLGDIVDGWRLKRGGWHWPQAHNDVVQKLLRKVRKGTRVTYVPGNHDDGGRAYVGLVMGGIALSHEAVHVGADRRRLLLIHGDLLDAAVTYAGWLVRLGDHASDWVVGANHALNRLRRGLGFPYWSLSAYLKRRVATAAAYIGEFERLAAAEARRRGFDGIVCGHIHHPAIRDIDGVRYCNDGDWVESCSALVEHADGRLEIIHWHRPTPVAAAASRALEPVA